MAKHDNLCFLDRIVVLRTRGWVWNRISRHFNRPNGWARWVYIRYMPESERELGHCPGPRDKKMLASIVRFRSRGWTWTRIGKKFGKTRQWAEQMYHTYYQEVKVEFALA